MEKQSNPIFGKIVKEQETEIFKEQASYKGVITKTAIMFGTLLLSVLGSLFLAGTNPLIYSFLLVVAFIMGLVSVFVASSSPRRAKVFSIIYAISEGFIVGLISIMFAASFPEFNVVGLAVIITLGIFAGMLILYMTKLIEVTSRFRRVMMGVSMGILVSLLFVGIVSLFDNGNTWHLLFGDVNSPLVLLITLVFIFYGSFMLVISFDDAKNIVNAGASKDYEWMVGLGLVVSTVYIYFQVLRLIAIILARRE